MPNPARTVIDLANLPPWLADDILANVERAAPESATEAMLLARRNVSMNPTRHPMFERDVRLLPHEWDAMEAKRYGRGGLQYVPNPNRERLVPNEYGDVPTDSLGNVRLPPMKRARRYFPKPEPQPYPYDADAVRAERRAHAARGILAEARKNPEVYDQLPAVFRLPLSDDLIARLAAESPQVVLRKAIQENPGVVGGLLGGGATIGGGIAYGLLGDE